ncbi:MAG: lipoyl synthase [Desulfovermiculus sp.]|nr:lipoyl synthase [Desulfovermiculus sp.]
MESSEVTMNTRKPDWLKIRFSQPGRLTEIKSMLRRLSLHTVCEEAACPNMMECFGRKTATFMILGKNCTRNCRFCNVHGGWPEPVDEQEPEHVAEAVAELGLKHVVVTSVTRDDLTDGGAGQFARVIQRLAPLQVTVEVLIPDFQGDSQALAQVVRAGPSIINHNVETVPRLYPEVRPQAEYERSLQLLARVKTLDSGIYTKSGLMLGLGETEDEVLAVLRDLRSAGCNVLTIGQYLAPSSEHYPVAEYVHPDVFAKYQDLAYDMGFLHAVAGPLVRSSYHADEFAPPED